MSQSTAGLLGTMRPPQRTASALLGGLAGVLTGLLAMAAVLVGWRRLAGAVDRSPEGVTLCLAGLMLVGLAAAARIACRLAARRGGRPVRLPASILTSAAMLLLAAGVSVPGPQAGAPHMGTPAALPLGVFWAMIVAEEFWAWRRGIRGRGIRDWGLGIGVAAEAASSGDLATSAELIPDPQCQIPNLKSQISNPQSLIPALPDDVLQQLTLSRDAEGRQQLSGWLRLPLEAGQRSGNLHVAFCPPFAEPPEVHFEQSGGPAGSIKAGQVLPYGARLEVKLAAPAQQPESVLVRFSAKTKS
jgi:hypothetical protein